jgi:hypothetical protein
VDTPIGKRDVVRSLNEWIRLVAQAFADLSTTDDYPVDFVCECCNETCFAVMPVPLGEWKAATAEAGYFVVRPGHVAAREVALVVTHDYAVVRLATSDEPTSDSAADATPRRRAGRC